MRTKMLLLVAVGLSALLTGCCGHGTGRCGVGGVGGCGIGGRGGSHSVMHGICDCEEDNHCASRAPWIRTGVPSTSEPVPVLPTKLPDGKKL